MIRVLIVDEAAAIRSGLLIVLEAADGMKVVGEAADASQGLDAAKEHEPDVVIMNFDGAGGGSEAARRLMRLPVPPRILALTTLNSEGSLLEVLHAGAAGFMLKDSRPEELTAAVRTVAAGGTVHAPEITKALIIQARGRTSLSSPDTPEKIATLTDSEREVLTLIGSGRTDQQIAEKLHISLASVKTYASRLLARFGLDHRGQAVILAYETGMAPA
ncbi:response regulator transcription factor [Streptomyces sp. NPDC051582]|uniref:response regulator transcription factor n=1 Tax=Streptomyces sp. NPDC051582 TaxID=3155167 RepID=UPI003445156B